MINKSWFVLELYTPTPPDVTDDFIYLDEDIQCANTVMMANYVYNEEVCNYMICMDTTNEDYTLENNEVYIDEESNSSYVNNVEVIHIER